MIVELPPRARRILERAILDALTGGTTSACAENTRVDAVKVCDFGNYLRVRGEYGVPVISRRPGRELPPRARRILPGLLFKRLELGTTSACAENTMLLVRGMAKARNYLRVRGEYLKAPREYTLKMELPPRARRIHGYALVDGFSSGTTSACAENTGHGC